MNAGNIERSIMEKAMNKQNCLYATLVVINALYALFVIGEMGIIAGKLHFKVLYVPGLIFSILIFPAALFFLWRVKGQIAWLDYTFLVIPLLLWLLIISGGSFTNFLFVNFPLIWTVSLLYLVRFSNIVTGKNIYFMTLILWLTITGILLAMNYFIPILPE